MNRQDIRKMFADGISDAARGLTVFTERHIENIRDMLPAAVVIIESVGVETDLSMNPIYSCNVDTTVLIDGTYDELDAIIDDIVPAIIARALLDYEGVGCSLANINYLDDIDAGITAATLTWSALYA